MKVKVEARYQLVFRNEAEEPNYLAVRVDYRARAKGLAKHERFSYCILPKETSESHVAFAKRCYDMLKNINKDWIASKVKELVTEDFMRKYSIESADRKVRDAIRLLNQDNKISFEIDIEE